MVMKEKMVVIKINAGKVSCTGHALHVIEKNGMYSWYFPGFEMFFSSTTREEGRQLAHAMAKSFFIYWLEKENNFNQMILEITKLGFKTIDHRATVNNILRGKKHKASFEVYGRKDQSFKNAEKEELKLVA
jgi:hypothetical protein